MVAVCPNAAAAACSGMLPGLVAGFYTFDDCHVDLAQLCTFASARLIHAEAVGIDKEVCFVSRQSCIALHCIVCRSHPLGMSSSRMQSLSHAPNWLVRNVKSCQSVAAVGS